MGAGVASFHEAFAESAVLRSLRVWTMFGEVRAMEEFGAGRTVLVVDDQPDFCEAMEYLLATRERNRSHSLVLEPQYR
jgi:hypothetical protein